MLIVAIVIGIVNACLAIALDFAMNYGHLLWKVRYNQVRKGAIRAGNMTLESEDGKESEIAIVDKFDENTEKGEIMGFGERIGYFDDLYWWVATFNNRIVWWICVKCLSYRIFVLVFIGSVVGLGLGISEALQLLFVGSSANLITIILLTTSRQGKE